MVKPHILTQPLYAFLKARVEALNPGSCYFLSITPKMVALYSNEARHVNHETSGLFYGPRIYNAAVFFEELCQQQLLYFGTIMGISTTPPPIMDTPLAFQQLFMRLYHPFASCNFFSCTKVFCGSTPNALHCFGCAYE